MIDNLAILIFSSAIVYTVFRAIKLDKVLPWFSADSEQQLKALRLEEQKKSRKGIRK